MALFAEMGMKSPCETIDNMRNPLDLIIEGGGGENRELKGREGGESYVDLCRAFVSFRRRMRFDAQFLFIVFSVVFA